jgi:GDP-L-fucose synthase
MKILITGATGFVGTILCKYLENQGHILYKLNSKNCDLTQQNSLMNYSREAFDQIFHLATWMQAGDFCLHHLGEIWIMNQQINTNVLSWWQKFQPQAKLVCIGTSCAYDPNFPLSEEYYLSGVPIESLVSYGMAKKMLYAGLLGLQKQYGVKFLCVIPSTLYGPGYHVDGYQMHFIFDLIRKILRGKLYDEPVTLWGDGYQRRELVYIDDFINILMKLVSTCENELINIGAGEEYPIRHFAQSICDYVDYPFEKIHFDPNAYVGAKSKCLDISKLRNLLPGLIYTPLEEGTAKTVDWFLAEREKVLPAKKDSNAI